MVGYSKERGIVEAHKVLVVEGTSLESTKTVYCWIMLAGVVLVQKFPVNKTPVLGSEHKDATLFEKYRHIPLFRWTDKWRERFYGMAVQTLLAVATSGQGITAKQSSISHPDFGLGLFAAWTIGTEMVLYFYWGLLVYGQPSKERQKTKTHCGRVMQLTAETFWKCAAELPEKVKNKQKAAHNTRLVSAPFCAMQHARTARYIHGYTTFESESLNNAGQKDVKLLQKRYPLSPQNISSYRSVSVHSLPSMARGEELLVHYRNKYRVYGGKRL